MYIENSRAFVSTDSQFGLPASNTSEEDESWSAQLFNENAAVAYLLLVSITGFLTLFVSSYIVEAWTKRSIRKRIEDVKVSRDTDSGTLKMCILGEKTEPLLIEACVFTNFKHLSRLLLPVGKRAL